MAGFYFSLLLSTLINSSNDFVICFHCLNPLLESFSCRLLVFFEVFFSAGLA